VFAGVIADQFVTEMVADSSFRQERTGLDGFLDAWRDWSAPWERLRIEVEEIREVGDKLWTPVVLVGVPKGTETEIRQRSGGVWTLADRKLTRVEFHLDPEVAKRAAGV
jgi:ketosteroid isomerase-like protein